MAQAGLPWLSQPSPMAANPPHGVRIAALWGTAAYASCGNDWLGAQLGHSSEGTGAGRQSPAHVRRAEPTKGSRGRRRSSLSSKVSVAGLDVRARAACRVSSQVQRHS